MEPYIAPKIQQWNSGKAQDTCARIVIVGNINENQTHPYNYKFKDILIFNSMHNAVTEPTRLLPSLAHWSTLFLLVKWNRYIQDFLTHNFISDHCGAYICINWKLSIDKTFKAGCGIKNALTFTNLMTRFVLTIGHFYQKIRYKFKS